MKKQFSTLVGLILIVFLIAGCTPSPSPSTPTPVVKTIKWQSDGAGFIQFYTNDQLNYEYGYWSCANQNDHYPMDPVETQVKKMSGYPNRGYGIIFCFQDPQNFYRLLIDTTGYYSVFKKVSDTYSSIQGWTYNSHLYTGYNIINALKVTRDNTTNTFSVFFNGSSTPDTTFVDTSFSGGICGFYASIGASTEEIFPTTPVDIRFRQITPLMASSLKINSANQMQTGMISDASTKSPQN